MSNTLNDVVEIVDSHFQCGRWNPIIGDTALRLANVFVETAILPSLESANGVILEARQIMASCNSPGETVSPRTGLVCGRVQSGKTSSMTSLAALARDNGFRIVVLIAGVTTILVDQNRERLQDTLRRASANHSWMMLLNPKAPRNIAEIQAVAQEWGSEIYSEDDRRTLLIIVMKNVTHLRNLAQLFNQAHVSSFPAIIIDDEADQASLNTRPLDIAPSAVNASISQLRSLFEHHTYLQYTATPQAPLLITRIDSLSADFAELVSPGDAYIGGESFFTQHNPHVIDIPPQDLFSDDTPPSSPPQSLLFSLQLFFLGAAAGRLSSNSNHRSMLIHPSQRTVTHSLYHSWVEALQAHWHRVLISPSELDFDDLVAQFRTAYENLGITETNLPDFESLLRKLPIAINQTSVSIVNSADGREIDWENAYSHILIGGEKLGRGYTIKGLTVTYMPRSPGGWTADTIQQRARFFGYHANYFGLCRLVLHPDIRSAYEAYLNHEIDMRQRLLEHRGKPLKEWKRLFYLDHRLEPTRKNILSSPYIKPEFSRNWFWARAPHQSREAGLFNRSLLQCFDEIQFTAYDLYQQHYYATIPLNEILEYILLQWTAFDEEDALGLCVMNCNMLSIKESNPKVLCRIIKMNNLQPRLRRLTDGIIPTLFQGPSSAGSDRYPGDHAFFENGIPTLQFHMLNIEEGQFSAAGIPAIAIHLPNVEDMVSHEE